jgi:hypothetical protein
MGGGLPISASAAGALEQVHRGSEIDVSTTALFDVLIDIVH